MSDDGSSITILAGAACTTRPAPDPERIQVAMRHPDLGWIGVELDRRAASKLASELQSFADYRSTPDVDA